MIGGRLRARGNACAGERSRGRNGDGAARWRRSPRPIGLSVPVMSAWFGPLGLFSEGLVSAACSARLFSEAFQRSFQRSLAPSPAHLVVPRTRSTRSRSRLIVRRLLVNIGRRNTATAGRGYQRIFRKAATDFPQKMRPTKRPERVANRALARHQGPSTMLDTARQLIAPSLRSAVPPFMVMDVMAAAARIEAAGGRVIHMEVRAAGRAGAGKRDRSRSGGAFERAPRLYRDARHSYAACPHCRHLWRQLRHRDRSSAHRRHDRVVSRLRPGVPRAVRAGGPGRGRAAGLSALSEHPQRARLRAGSDRDVTIDALGDHARDADRGASQAPLKAC